MAWMQQHIISYDHPVCRMILFVYFFDSSNVILTILLFFVKPISLWNLVIFSANLIVKSV